MYKIYGDAISGNCYKIKLLMSLLNIEHEWIHVDVVSGDTRQPGFIEKNPNGKVPLLEISKGEYLSESNAIINYLADGTDYLPSDRLQRARVLEWQFFEQYSHEPFIAVARFINTYLGLPAEREEEFHSKQEGGHKALAIMESALSRSDYLVGGTLTIADISLYAYTHVAEEGGFRLQGYPHILAWFKRIESTKGYIQMSA